MYLLVSSDAKVSISVTIWIALTHLTRLNYLHRMRSLANCLVVLVRTRSILMQLMQLECGLPLDVGQWQIILHLFAVGCVAPSRLF